MPAMGGLMTSTRFTCSSAVVLAALLLTSAAVPVETAGAGPQQTRPRGDSLAPFVPTPQDVVERMLALAQVTKEDVVYDLGSGDGRLVVTAAQKYGARGVGIDIDPDRIEEGQANAKRANVEHLVEFRLGDAMQADLSGATVVTLYLLSSSNAKLRPILTRQLKPGARIVSHQFGMGDWTPDKVDTFTDQNGTSRSLYLWRTDGTARN
jgi:SAM-dependent methyltransferase